MAPPAKRRIQPQLISPSHAQPSAVVNNLSGTGLQGGGPSQDTQQNQLGYVNSVAQHIPEPKDDSESAARLSLKGRRIYVTLEKGQSNDINFKKVGHMWEQILGCASK